MQKGKHPGEFLFARSQTSMTGKWYVDSVASFRIANSTIWFAKDSLETVSPFVIRLGDVTSVHATQKGTVHVMPTTRTGCKDLEIKDVLNVPEIATNILSVGAMESRGHQVTFKDFYCTITGGNSGKPLLSISRSNFTYSFQAPKTEPTSDKLYLANENN